MNTNKKKPNSISMTQGAWDIASEMAKKENRSLSNWFERLVTTTHNKLKSIQHN